MFFFYIILLIVCLLIVITIGTTIKIELKNIEFTTDSKCGRYWNKDYKIVIKLVFLGKVNYLKLNITKSQMEKNVVIKGTMDLKNKMLIDKNSFDVKVLKLVKNLKLKIEKLDLNVDIGLKNAATNSLLVGGISGIISIILGKMLKEPKNAYWKIRPIYQNRNLLNISLDCIISLKMIHIIYTIYVFKKEMNIKNGRASN